MRRKKRATFVSLSPIPISFFGLPHGGRKKCRLNLKQLKQGGALVKNRSSPHRGRAIVLASDWTLLGSAPRLSQRFEHLCGREKVDWNHEGRSRQSTVCLVSRERCRQEVNYGQSELQVGSDWVLFGVSLGIISTRDWNFAKLVIDFRPDSYLAEHKKAQQERWLDFSSLGGRKLQNLLVRSLFRIQLWETGGIWRLTSQKREKERIIYQFQRALIAISFAQNSLAG